MGVRFFCELVECVQVDDLHDFGRVLAIFYDLLLVPEVAKCFEFGQSHSQLRLVVVVLIEVRQLVKQLLRQLFVWVRLYRQRHVDRENFEQEGQVQILVVLFECLAEHQLALFLDQGAQVDLLVVEHAPGREVFVCAHPELRVRHTGV